MAKAVANETSATFFRVVGSELVQKYTGEGPKLVRELFRLAHEHAPSIVFIDEIDSIGHKRTDSNSGAKREIQRTMLELLNQLDGFDTSQEVKVILATNRIESLGNSIFKLKLKILRLSDQEELIEKFTYHSQIQRLKEEYSPFTQQRCRWEKTLT